MARAAVFTGEVFASGTRKARVALAHTVHAGAVGAVRGAPTNRARR